jgi:protein-S-isoprenylcysteine O-methyltransferase Ste14
MNTQDTNDNAGVVGRPPITYAASMLAGHFIDIYVPLALPGGDERVMAGRIISALSFALFLWSVPLFKRYGTSVKPYRPTSAIIKTGPYRFSRNPIYLSMALLHFGVALWNGTWWMLITLAVTFWFMTKFVVEREESYLERSFGEEYMGYKRSVRRWL